MKTTDAPFVIDELPPVADWLTQFVALHPPVGKGHECLRSRIGQRVDGTIIPILWAMADRKFGTYSTKRFEPAWADGNWENETWDNVKLFSESALRKLQTRTDSPLAGTPAYQREYYTKNKERVRKWHRDWYTAKKAEVAELRRENATLRAGGTAPAEDSPAAIGTNRLREMSRLTPEGRAVWKQNTGEDLDAPVKPPS